MKGIDKMQNQDKKHSSDWSTFKDSLDISKEDLFEIDLRVQLMGKLIEIRKELAEHGICHAILETEDEACDDVDCKPNLNIENTHHHHHHN